MQEKTKKQLTRLQTVIIITGIVLFLLWCVSAMVADSADRPPSETLFQNSQTLNVIGV